MVFFISDPHLGHRNIAKFRPFVSSTEDNTKQFVDQWKKTIRKDKAIVYMLGDVAFDQESLDLLKTLQGRKILIKGNHDHITSTASQAEVFEEIHGMLSYKHMWLTHCPIHPAEMRNRIKNVHGHVHHQSIKIKKMFGEQLDPRYFNACVDRVLPEFGSWFTTLDQIRK